MKESKRLHYFLLALLLLSAFIIFLITIQVIRASEYGKLVDFPIISLLILLSTVSTLAGLMLYPILK